MILGHLFIHQSLDSGKHREEFVFLARKPNHTIFFFPFHTDVVKTIMDSPACAARDTQKGHQPILSQFAR